MKVALVHDWLVTYAGAERILEQLIRIYPEADVYSLVDFVPEDQRHFLQGRPVHTSFIQKLPFARKRFRHYLSLFPLAIQQFNFNDYDLVLSVSFAVAKGIITGPDQTHLCICCSPVRYAWDLQEEYLAESGMRTGLKGWLARVMLHRLRLWDAAMGHLPDHYLSISHFVARRVRKFYGRESTILYPPVNVDGFDLKVEKEDFYLAASRQVPYKHINTIVRAFRSMPDRKLVVIGDGPDAARIRASAAGAPNITLMGHQPFSVLKDHMQRARAFLFASKEDFGIVPLEAQACGTPVIAFSGGGAMETIVGAATPPPEPGLAPTGVFFDEQTPEAIAAAVRAFEDEAAPFTPDACRANALRFSEGCFRERLEACVAAALAAPNDRTPLDDRFPPKGA